MRLARFVNKGISNFTIVRKRINLGDNIQSLSVKNLCNYIGYVDDNIIEISYFDMNISINEEVKLIFQGHFDRNIHINTSKYKNIIPVYIGYALMDINLNINEILYLKKYEPIICRDEYTRTALRHYGIDAYTGGCLSLTFPKRDKSIKGKKIFFVDVPETLIKHIPKKILEHSVFTSHLIQIDPNTLNDEDFNFAEIEAIKLLEQYKNEASLIVTSRLHCLCPCIGMGIPVIAVQNNFSYRFSFLDKFVHLYTPDEFADIDWNPQVVDCDEIKTMLLKIAEQKLNGENVDNNLLLELDEFYEKRDRVVYCKNIKQQLNKLKEYVTEDFEFIIWGIGAGGNTVYECIKEIFPKSRLKVAVDNFIKGQFNEVDIISSDEIIMYSDCYIFITTISGELQAIEKMRELGKNNVKDYLFLHENRYSTDLD